MHGADPFVFIAGVAYEDRWVYVVADTVGHLGHPCLMVISRDNESRGRHFGIDLI